MWERFSCWPPLGQNLEDYVDDLYLQAQQGREGRWEEWTRGLESTLAHVKKEMWEGHPLIGPTLGKNQKKQEQERGGAW